MIGAKRIVCPYQSQQRTEITRRPALRPADGQQAQQ